MKIPYAISDFEQIAKEGYSYVDRTDRIPFTENIGKYLLFLRPRRFGKSLWLTTLRNYYDLAKSADFEQMFGNLSIGKNPTPLHSQYFVMEWDFSCVDSSGSLDEIRKSLFSHINSRISFFCSYYAEYLPSLPQINRDNAISSFESFLGSIIGTGHKLCLFIDEYDNFANEMMARRRQDDYYRMTGLDGFMKTLFKSLKSATKGMGLERMYITGVTPILMSDITSGDNIRTDMHLMPGYADLCGFTKEELEKLIRTFADWLETRPRFVFPEGTPMFPEGKEKRIRTLLHLCDICYNGYRFCESAETRVYNPTLVMYLLQQITAYDGEFPRSIMDPNLAADEGRLEFISDLPGGKEVIMELMQGKDIEDTEIIPRFGLRTMLDQKSKTHAFIVSYLYFMGMLTLSDSKSEHGYAVFSVPNPVVKKLYVSSIAQWLVPESRERDDGTDAAKILYTRGDMAPVCAFVQDRIFPVFNWRDMRWVNELTIKTMFLSLMFNDVSHLMVSERQTRAGYADLAMIVRPDRREYKLADILIEFKFIRLKTLNLTKEELAAKSDPELLQMEKIKEKMQSAKAQAQTYSAELKKEFGDVMQLKTFAVTAIGFERIVWEPI